MIEQPLSSLLFKYKPMFSALWDTGAYWTHVHLGSFGCLYKKPIRLWGTAPFLMDLNYYSRKMLLTSEYYLKLATVDEQGRVTGDGEAGEIVGGLRY